MFVRPYMPESGGFKSSSKLILKERVGEMDEERRSDVPSL